MSNLEKLTEELSQLSILDASKLISILEKKWGVQASSHLNSATQNINQSVLPDNKKTEFNVELLTVGQKKIQVIKTVREITGLGLKEAKDLVDKAPKTIKTGISKENAESIKKKLEDSGATIKIV